MQSTEVCFLPQFTQAKYPYSNPELKEKQAVIWENLEKFGIDIGHYNPSIVLNSMQKNIFINSDDYVIKLFYVDTYKSTQPNNPFRSCALYMAMREKVERVGTESWGEAFKIFMITYNPDASKEYQYDINFPSYMHEWDYSETFKLYYFNSYLQELSYNTLNPSIPIFDTEELGLHFCTKNDWVFIPNSKNPLNGNSANDDRGGKGSYNTGSDVLDYPSLPTENTVTSGFTTSYIFTHAGLQALGNVLFDSTIVKTLLDLFGDVMNAIFSLSYCPVYIEDITTSEVPLKIGGLALPELTANRIDKQFYKISLGSVFIDEFYGSYLDYNPCTSVSVYLPYIGMKQLNTNEVMNSTISIIYYIDIISGTCVANLRITKDGKAGKMDAVLYSFTGMVSTQLPISSTQFSNVVSGVMSAISLTQDAIVFPSNPVGALTKTVSDSASALSGFKKEVSKSGTVAGFAGMMSIKEAYIIIERPILSMPQSYNFYNGWNSNVTSALGSLAGFTQFQTCYIDIPTATDSEKAEILNLLKSGVIV